MFLLLVVQSYLGGIFPFKIIFNLIYKSQKVGQFLFEFSEKVVIKDPILAIMSVHNYRIICSLKTGYITGYIAPTDRICGHMVTYVSYIIPR